MSLFQRYKPVDPNLIPSFCNEWARLIDLGDSPHAALSHIAEKNPDKALKTALQKVLDSIVQEKIPALFEMVDRALDTSFLHSTDSSSEPINPEGDNLRRVLLQHPESLEAKRLEIEAQIPDPLRSQIKRAAKRRVEGIASESQDFAIIKGFKANAALFGKTFECLFCVPADRGSTVFTNFQSLAGDQRSGFAGFVECIAQLVELDNRKNSVGHDEVALRLFSFALSMRVACGLPFSKALSTAADILSNRKDELQKAARNEDPILAFTNYIESNAGFFPQSFRSDFQEGLDNGELDDRLREFAMTGPLNLGT